MRLVGRAVRELWPIPEDFALPIVKNLASMAMARGVTKVEAIDAKTGEKATQIVIGDARRAMVSTAAARVLMQMGESNRKARRDDWEMTRGLPSDDYPDTDITPEVAEAMRSAALAARDQLQLGHDDDQETEPGPDPEPG